MTHTIHDELLRAIKDSASNDENPVDILIGIIPMSKEAAYRRLRGEIQFTLDEAVKIMQKLKISLQNLAELYVDSNRTNLHLYDLSALTVDNMDQYLYMLKYMKDTFAKLTENFTPHIYNAATFIPYGISMRYQMLIRFALFKWIFQMKKSSNLMQLSDVHIPEEIERERLEFVDNVDKFNATYIFVDDLVYYTVKSIVFFKRLGLVSHNECQLLKKELHLLINQLEQYANTGKNEKGYPVSIYVSDISFDASYIYIEGPSELQIFSVNLYGLNFLGTEYPNICCLQKEWIDSLVRYSNLITGCGELERINFFKKQRKFLEAL